MNKSSFSTIMALLCCLMLAGLTGCSSRQQTPQGPMPESSRLQNYSAKSGSSVFVEVHGLDKSENEDLASLVTASLQSERSLVPADSRAQADTVIDIKVQDIYLAGSSGARMSGSQTLGNTVLGTVLGLGVGSIAGGRTGALIGAGTGALLGLGASAADAKSDNTWAMRTTVAIGSPNAPGADQEHAVSTQGRGMTREDCITALKDQLSQDIVHCIGE